MKKLVATVSFAIALLGAAPPPAPAENGSELATERHVHGVITAIDPAKITISSSQRSITGKIDPARTKVTIHGKPAKLSDLAVTAHAKAELCLDDVWLTIAAH